MIDPQLRLLLLRRLPAEETARLEELILLEDNFAEQLRDAEFDLLDDYAASRLSAEDAGDVDRYLLTSEESRHSLRVARALRKAGNSVDAQPRARPAAASGNRRRRAPRRLGFAALLAACLVAVVYLPQWHTPFRLGAGQPSPGQSELPIISLLADVNRGPLRPSFALPSAQDTVRLQAEVPDPSTGARYSLVIQDSAGRRLFAAPALEVHAAGRYRFVETEVPVEALGPGDRTILLTDPDVAANADAKFTWQVSGVID